jgi:hypothetical protein
MELCSTTLEQILVKRRDAIDSNFKIKIFHGIMKGVNDILQ